MKKILSLFRRRAPKISVCTPLYNTHPEHLRKNIESVLGQTFADFEFLILNDSPANKELDSIVREYRDPRIIYRKNKTRLGISGARNRLLDMARGEYIAVLDHDDMARPEWLMTEMEFLDDNPNYGAVTCNFAMTEDWGQLWSYTYLDNLGIKKYFAIDPSFPHSGSMLRKSVLDAHGIRYEAAYSPAEDNRLFMRLAEVTLLKILPQHLLYFRMHGDNTSALQDGRMRACRGELAFQFKNKYPMIGLESNFEILSNKIGELAQKLDALLDSES